MLPPKRVLVGAEVVAVLEPNRPVLGAEVVAVLEPKRPVLGAAVVAAFEPNRLVPPDGVAAGVDEVLLFALLNDQPPPVLLPAEVLGVCCEPKPPEVAPPVLPNRLCVGAELAGAVL